MSGDQARRALATLAARHRLETAYHDGTGQWREAPPGAVAGVLRALGVPLDGPDDAPRALAALDAGDARPGCEPVAVAWEGAAAMLPLRLPADLADARASCALALEDGAVRAWEAAPESAPGAEAPGGSVARRLALPEGLPWGYHRLAVEVEGHTLRATVIAAPRRAPPVPRTGQAWGLFAPTYALRSERPGWGCGDLGLLRQLAARVRALGGSLVGTLPLNAAFLGDEPHDPSPYAPVSRRFWNELFLDLGAVPEFHASPEAQALATAPSTEAARRDLDARDLMDPRAVMALKRPVLEAMARFLLATPSPRRDAFQAWRRADPLVDAYARFRAVTEAQGKGWPAWPERLQRGEVRPGDYDSAVADYHAYVQWLCEDQLAGLAAELRDTGPGLYLDLPLGVHGAGFDAWHDRDVFAEGVSAGAPPDGFFTRGQDWGFAPLHPGRIRAQGYAYLADSLRRQLRHAGMLRIDHVMGLHRLYWVPRGFDATQGVYVHYRPEELYAVLVLEAARAGAAVVGEDLGTVPPQVRPAMEAHGLLRMHVLQIEASPDPARTLPPASRAAVASLNTHDMPPFAAYWEEHDVDDRVGQGLLDAGGAEHERRHRAATRDAVGRALRAEGHAPPGEGPPGTAAALRGCLAHLAAGPAAVVIVNLDDLGLSPLPQNYPGAPADARPSWRRRAPLAVETLDGASEARETLRTVDRLRRGGDAR